MGNISIEDLLNDPSLNAELMALAGANSVVIEQSSSYQRRPAPQPVKAHHQAPETLHFESIDEAEIMLTEEDMNDPELLAQLEILQNGGAVKSKVISPSPVQVPPVPPMPPKPVRVPALVRAPVPRSEPVLVPKAGMTVSEAKQLAHKFNKQGNTEEALKVCKS